MDSELVEFTQKIVDESIDWLRAFVQTVLNAQHQDLRELVVGNRKELEESSEIFQTRSAEVYKEMVQSQEMLENLTLRLKDDNTDLIRFK